MTSYKQVEQLPKFIYKPILEKIQEAYLVNAQKDYEPGFDIVFREEEEEKKREGKE